MAGKDGGSGVVSERRRGVAEAEALQSVMLCKFMFGCLPLKSVQSSTQMHQRLERVQASTHRNRLE